ncbi:MAG: hypothetical protein J6M48_10085 [Ruminococcus sp.]|nr:hypothetical protein [Ruminococcus sp.]
MIEKNDILQKMNMIIHGCKSIYSVVSSLVVSQNNISMRIESRLDMIDKQLAELKNEIQKNGKLLTGEYHIYTDFELYNLKKSMSWQKLSIKTNIPLSTLQYRYRRYIKENGGN